MWERDLKIDNKTSQENNLRFKNHASEIVFQPNLISDLNVSVSLLQFTIIRLNLQNSVSYPQQEKCSVTKNASIDHVRRAIDKVNSSIFNTNADEYLSFPIEL